MPVFQFKKFSVCDNRATMKVGTDAVVLGAWTDIVNVTTILDIGTGSGVIALMLAQRTNEHVSIDAIELLKEDSQQAIENVLNSFWPKKILVMNITLQQFHPETKYDLIVCNPPYFTKSLLPPTQERSNARHGTQLTFDELITAAIDLIQPEGKLSVILPAIEADTFITKASSKKFYLNRLTRFFSKVEKNQERSLMEFSLTARTFREDSLVLYQSENRWTEDYCRLTGDFYLDR